MKKTNKTDNNKARFMVAARDLIVKAKPELTGHFTTLHIWEDLSYLYSKNWTPENAASNILKTDYSTTKL